MKVLNLFSGTHSFGKVCESLMWDSVSLDRDLNETDKFSDYVSDYHIKEDIMTWDYKNEFDVNEFDIITASPVCLWWSRLRNTWIGRKMKSHGDTIITKEILQNDIDKFGKPMVDKVFEIIEYFKPKFYIIENPATGLMKHYITEKYSEYDKYFDVDYCKYSDWGYKKTTRFWTNIKDFKPKICKKDCENIVKTQHKVILANGIETIDNKKVYCNTKAKRDKLREIKKTQKIHKERMGSNKTINDNGKIIRVNTAELRKKYKDYPNIQKTIQHKEKVCGGRIGGGSNRLERYRIPPNLIEDLFLCCISI